MAKYGSIAQIGMVVEDIDSSVQRWIGTMGVGPWTVLRNITLMGCYRGQDVVVKMDVGLGYQGETQIELIQVTNGAKSPYLDDDGTPLAGLHHLAWTTDDLDAVVSSAEADGLRLVFRADSPGNRVAYLEGEGEKGVLFEFIENGILKQMIAEGIAASRNWDGTDPIRIIDFEA